jgi:hypothetical protein
MAIADALDDLLAHPGRQDAAFDRLRTALGPPDSLARCARFALALLAR